MMGLSTAFQILVGPKGEGGDVKRVHRVELAALMTTLYKFARAVDLCQQMTQEEPQPQEEPQEQEQQSTTTENEQQQQPQEAPV